MEQLNIPLITPEEETKQVPSSSSKKSKYRSPIVDDSAESEDD